MSIMATLSLLHACVCQIHDTVGGYGGGKRFYLPPAALKGTLELEALRAFVRDPSAAKSEL
jgi:hypothetical protein